MPMDFDSTPQPARQSTASIQETEPTWAVRASIVAERLYGHGGAEIRRGTKHFALKFTVFMCIQCVSGDKSLRGNAGCSPPPPGSRLRASHSICSLGGGSNE